MDIQSSYENADPLTFVHNTSANMETPLLPSLKEMLANVDNMRYNNPATNYYQQDPHLHHLDTIYKSGTKLCTTCPTPATRSTTITINNNVNNNTTNNNIGTKHCPVNIPYQGLPSRFTPSPQHVETYQRALSPTALRTTTLFGAPIPPTPITAANLQKDNNHTTFPASDDLDAMKVTAYCNLTWSLKRTTNTDVKNIFEDAIAKTLTPKSLKHIEKHKRMKTPRVCRACGSISTPQWRSGPLGRGTLCNACGLKERKKSKKSGVLQDMDIPGQKVDVFSYQTCS